MLVLLLASCVHRPPESAVSPFDVQDVPPVLDAAAMLADSLPDSTPAACYATASVSTALRSAASVVRAEGLLLPAIEVNVSGCGPLPAGSDVPAAVGVATAVLPLAALAVEGSMECHAAVWLRASAAYAQGVAPAIIDEISSPDGLVSVPAMAVDLSGCPS